MWSIPVETSNSHNGKRNHCFSFFQWIGGAFDKENFNVDLVKGSNYTHDLADGYLETSIKKQEIPREILTTWHKEAMQSIIHH